MFNLLHHRLVKSVLRAKLGVGLPTGPLCQLSKTRPLAEAKRSDQFVDIHVIGGFNPKDFDVLISDIGASQLKHEVADTAGIPYHSPAAEQEANTAVQVGNSVPNRPGCPTGHGHHLQGPAVVYRARPSSTGPGRRLQGPAIVYRARPSSTGPGRRLQSPVGISPIPHPETPARPGNPSWASSHTPPSVPSGLKDGRTGRLGTLVGNCFIYGPNLHTIFPAAVTNYSGKAFWVFFLVDTGSPRTYLSTRTSDLFSFPAIREDTPMYIQIAGRQRHEFRAPQCLHFVDINILSADFIDAYEVSLVYSLEGQVAKLFFNRKAWRVLVQGENM
ncbi:hypothetical protein HOY82DRAFT_669667 [Tuber indicum]|nr:hypothetical protein HOY82DRAFT_669667 [Tuber indicum]